MPQSVALLSIFWAIVWRSNVVSSVGIGFFRQHVNQKKILWNNLLSDPIAQNQRTTNSAIHLDTPPHPLISWPRERVCSFYDRRHSSYNLLPLSDFKCNQIEHSPAADGTWYHGRGRTMLLHGVRPNEEQKHLWHQQGKYEVSCRLGGRSNRDPWLCGRNSMPLEGMWFSERSDVSQTNHAPYLYSSGKIKTTGCLW